MVTPGVLRPDLRALPQLGQPDQLLVQPSVLLDLVASPRYLHFDSVFLLLLGKMPLSTCKFTSITINYLEEVVFVILVVAVEWRGMPTASPKLPTHTAVRSDSPPPQPGRVPELPPALQPPGTRPPLHQPAAK